MLDTFKVRDKRILSRSSLVTLNLLIARDIGRFSNLSTSLSRGLSRSRGTGISACYMHVGLIRYLDRQKSGRILHVSLIEWLCGLYNY